MEAWLLPGHRSEAAGLHRAALVLAVLVNGCDRQGDLSRWRIGREITRTEAGWRPAFRQGKTGNGKDNGCLWPPVSAIIDAHVLGDRPAWRMEERLAELDGMNLLSLAAEPLDTYLASKILREEFGIGAHLVRTLATDFLRRHRPDAAWAVKMLLGHTSLTMQRAYQTDFREAAAVEKAQATTTALVAAAAANGKAKPSGKTKGAGTGGELPRPGDDRRAVNRAAKAEARPPAKIASHFTHSARSRTSEVLCGSARGPISGSGRYGRME